MQKRPWRERKLFARLSWAEYRRRYDKALVLLDELETLRSLELPEQALKAMLLLRNFRPEESHDLFLTIRDATKGRDDPEHQYIRHYAQAWLAYIRFNPFNIREQERKAAEIDCKPSLKRLLWLPQPDRPDPMDEAFDAWMKANYPKDDDLPKRRIS